MTRTWGSLALADDPVDAVTLTMGRHTRPERYGVADEPVVPRAMAGVRSSRGIEAWMLVLPVDAVALLLPIVWAPQYWRGFLAMTVLSLLLLTGGGRYRAKLHLSVLDEVPTIVARLLTAAALVAGVFALRHDGDGVSGFLAAALVAIGLVVAGRVVTTAVILSARRRSVVAHRTVLIGGGELATEVATLLRRYPRYGLSFLFF